MDKHTQKKQGNQVLTRLIKRFVSEQNWEMIKDCSTFMMFVSDESMENKKQYKGNSCKNRFCPICAWKKAKKDALSLSVQMKYIVAEHKKKFIFLTLTAPNVPGEELKDEINKYNKAFKNLMQRKEIKAIAKGYVRKLEITYNRERNDFHPHFHVLVSVNKSYFTDKDYYISRDRWLELWQQVTDNPKITQVDVRKVGKKREIEDSQGKEFDNYEQFESNGYEEFDDSALEVAKYAAKDEDYLLNEDVFEVFYKALKGRQIIVYSGLFKESKKLFENGELDHYKEQDLIEYVYALLYTWGKGEYVEDEIRLLTEEERRQVNHAFIDEIIEDE